MSQLLSIIIAAALVNNVVLVQLLGVSSLFAYSSKLRNAIELAWIGGGIMFISSVLNLLLYRYLLLPLQLEFLKLICFVLVSAGLTSLLLLLLKNKLALSLRRQSLEFYLLSGNGAIIGLALLSANSLQSLRISIAASFGAALGFALLLVIFAALRQRLDAAAIPEPLRGAPIQLISAGIVAMCLLGFAGVA